MPVVGQLEDHFGPALEHQHIGRLQRRREKESAGTRLIANTRKASKVSSTCAVCNGKHTPSESWSSPYATHLDIVQGVVVGMHCADALQEVDGELAMRYGPEVV